MSIRARLVSWLMYGASVKRIGVHWGDALVVTIKRRPGVSETAFAKRTARISRLAEWLQKTIGTAVLITDGEEQVEVVSYRAPQCPPDGRFSGSDPSTTGDPAVDRRRSIDARTWAVWTGQEYNSRWQARVYNSNGNWAVFDVQRQAFVDDDDLIQISITSLLHTKIQTMDEPFAYRAIDPFWSTATTEEMQQRLDDEAASTTRP